MAVEELLRQKKTEFETTRNNVKSLRAQIEAALAKGEAASEDQTKLNAMVDSGMKIREAITGLENELALTTELKVDEGAAERLMRNGGSVQLRKSWGQQVIESAPFKAKTLSRENPFEIGNFNQFLKGGSKALYSTVDAAGGATIVTQREPEILDIARRLPRSVIDLVTHTTTNSDLVEYVLMTGRTENAAVVAERTATNGSAGDDVFGLKPESTRTFAVLNAAVQTIAAYVLISRQLLNDSKQMRTLVDDELTYEVEKKLEAVVIAGVLAWSGIQTRVHADSGSARASTDDTIADTLRRAITDLVLEFYYPTGIVLNPAQGEALELHKDDIQNYTKVYDSVANRVWRVPVLETPAMTAGSALVADWKLAVKVWDREQTQILTGQPDDLFLRNAFAILAELRAAYAVVRPKAVEKITGLAA